MSNLFVTKSNKLIFFHFLDDAMTILFNDYSISESVCQNYLSFDTFEDYQNMKKIIHRFTEGS